MFYNLAGARGICGELDMMYSEDGQILHHRRLKSGFNHNCHELGAA